MAEAQVLNRRAMQEPQALTTFQERGAINGDVAISNSRGGVRFENMLQVMEFAKMMALADIGVPAHLRANPGACLRIALQADAWGFDPFSVADKSYAVGGRISYESQLVHAVVERRAPMDGRLRPSWEGSIEDGTRKCKIIGKLIGEAEPFVWESPMIKDIKTKNSPEWGANPDKQLFYHASRDWARIYVPDVLLGVYTRDEIENSNFGPDRARDVSDLASRLPASAEDGYDADGIAKTLREATGAISEDTGSKEAAKANAAQAAPVDAKGTVIEHSEETGEVSAEEMEHLKGGADPGDPTTKDEYTSYAQQWIMAAGDQKIAESRWEGERELRAKCKVSVAERKRLEKMLNERFA